LVGDGVDGLREEGLNVVKSRREKRGFSLKEV
jgi:hypothetical protein